MPKVVLSMPEKFLNDVDNIAKKESRTRSELIREALRSYIYKGLTANASKTATDRKATLLRTREAQGQGQKLTKENLCHSEGEARKNQAFRKVKSKE